VRLKARMNIRLEPFRVNRRVNVFTI